MLKSNTMRYGSDEFTFDKSAFLISKVPLDASDATSVEGFTIDGGEPTDTGRKILFKVDNEIVKFVDGSLVTVGGGETYSNVNTNGNTVEELLSVTDVPDWAGKLIYPMIALSAPADALVYPSIKMSLKARSNTDVYEKTIESMELKLGDESRRISDVEVVGSVTGNAAYTVTASLKDNETWSDWIAIQNIRDMDASAVKFKIHYRVNTVGGNDSAKVSKITVHYADGKSTVSGDIAEIYSVMRDYKYPLGVCALTVRHKQLIDSKINAFVNFAKPPKTRTFLPLGVSDGSRQTYILGVNGKKDTGIDQSTLQVFADGLRVLVYSYNTETSELSVQLDPGKSISVTYDYDREVENWRTMTADVTQEPFSDGSFLTRFTYSLPEEELDNQTVTNIRIQLERTHGSVTDEVLGTATGFSQQFVLQHAAKVETLKINADFTYDEGSQVVTCAAKSGTVIKASYDWTGETHTIYSWAAGWSPAI